MLTYALGRGIAEGDEPALLEIVREWGTGRRTIGRLIETIVNSAVFRRRGPEEQAE